jgi:hypothetical protein
MKLLRREFLLAGAALAGVRILQGQVDSSFTLQFPPVALDASQPVSLAVVASAPCTLQVQLLGEGNRPLLEPWKWSMEPKSPVSVLNQSVKAGIGEKTLGLRAFVYPSGRKRPHIAGVLQTGTESDKDRLERTAGKVPFFKDPAPRPEEGHFTVSLRAESNVQLRIWRGDNQNGPIIREELVKNLSVGENPIPWDLRNNRKSIVDPGEYLATLAAIPENTSRSNTLFFASFEVI